MSQPCPLYDLTSVQSCPANYVQRRQEPNFPCSIDAKTWKQTSECRGLAFADPTPSFYGFLEFMFKVCDATSPKLARLGFMPTKPIIYVCVAEGTLSHVSWQVFQSSRNPPTGGMAKWKEGFLESPGCPGLKVLPEHVAI